MHAYQLGLPFSERGPRWVDGIQHGIPMQTAARSPSPDCSRSYRLLYHDNGDTLIPGTVQMLVIDIYAYQLTAGL